MNDFSRCDICRRNIRSFRSRDSADPRGWLLPCLHVICSPCKAFKSQAPPNLQTFVCPICKTECPKTLSLLIPEAKSCITRCETAACPEKKIATVKCLSCNELLCHECGIAHRRVTATSQHVLQPVEEILPEQCRCPVHNNLRAVYVCSCGLAACSECIRLRIHDGPQHTVNDIAQLAASSSFDKEKIRSSTAREIAQIDIGISSVSVKKQMVSQRIDSLKKEIGNSVVKACNAIVKRGWDIINTLDFVKQGKVEELDRICEELHWQRLRFNRINLYVDLIKNFDEPVSIVLTKAYLDNCIHVLKAKKKYNEGIMHVLQQASQVELKSSFDQIISLVGQCGHVYAGSSDGLLREVEIRPASRTAFNFFPYETNNACASPSMNSGPSTSSNLLIHPLLASRMDISPCGSSGRMPLTPGHIRMFQQQQHQQQNRLRNVQEIVMRHPSSAMQLAYMPGPRLPLFRFRFGPSVPSSSHAGFPISSPPSFVSSTTQASTLGPENCALLNGSLSDAPLQTPVPAATLMEQLNGQSSERGGFTLLKQSDIHSKKALAQASEDSSKILLDKASKESRDGNGAVLIDLKSEDVCSPSTLCPLNVPVNKNMFTQIPAETSQKNSESTSNSNDCAISDRNDKQSHSDAYGRFSPRIQNSKLEGSIELCGSTELKILKPQVYVEDPSCSGIEVSSSDQQNSLIQGREAVSQSHRLPTCGQSSFFDQGKGVTSATSSDNVQKESPMGSLNSCSGRDEIQDLFFNRASQLHSDSEEQSVQRERSPTSKIIGSDEKPLELAFHPNSSSTAMELTGVHGIEADNAEENIDNEDEMNWEDYCYVCQQGCDERTGSLGCCAKCPRVYHNLCHIPAIKEKMETLPDEWKCSLCVPCEPFSVDSGIMGPTERLLCAKVLLRCYADHQNVQPFCHPVSRNVANYYVVIKTPMDFGTIARRLKEKVRDAFTNVSQFICSMNLVFENCSTFNPPHTEVAKAGREVYQLYVRAVNEILPCMKNLIWLYITKYSESKVAAAVQKEAELNFSRSSRLQGNEKSGDEMTVKRARRDL